MDYSTAVSQTWRHSNPPLVQADYRELVRYATLAASSHNTQPWRFEVDSNSIALVPDFSRRCTAVDPDDHHLFASLGCAVENLLLAAEAAGLKGRLSYDAETPRLTVSFEQATPNRSPLFDAILTRQCTRTKFDGRPLSTEQLRLLSEAGQGSEVSVLLLTNEQQKNEVAQYVARANTIQFADDAWATELRAWIRFCARDAIRTGDGLYGPVMGNPDVPPWLGKLFMRLAFSLKAQNRKDARSIQSSGAIAVIFSEKDDPRHWIEAGRCYQRLALQAAALDLPTAFINQPVEVTDLRPEFARYLGLDGKRPDLVVRIGHGPLTQKSLRRPLDDVIVTAGDHTRGRTGGGPVAIPDRARAAAIFDLPTYSLR
ncbi:MAG: nitroreductase family protein [Woeseiaceae bacterium]